MGDLRLRRRMMMEKAQEENEYFFTTSISYAFYTAPHSSFQGYACQGGCFANNKWYSLIITQDSSTQYLYCYDLVAKSWSLLNTYTTLYHANSLSYNPTENEFYVATGYAEYGYAIIDGSTYQQKSSVIAKTLNGTAFAPWNVACDRSRNLLYSHVGSTLYVNSISGTCIAERTLDGYVSHTTGQGMETDGKYIYICWSDNVDTYTVSGKFVKTTAFGADKELEEIGYDWNGRFYCQEFYGTGIPIRLSSFLFRTVNGWAQMAGVPFNDGYNKATNATIVYTDLYGVRITSSGSASYNMYTIGSGYPWGYSFLSGKTCRVSFDLKRTSGSSGYIGSNLFTCTNQKLAVLNNRLFHKTKSVGSTLALNDTMHFEYELVWGQGDYAPPSDKQGTYIGYLLFLYAASGNGFEISNYKFEVKMT